MTLDNPVALLLMVVVLLLLVVFGAVASVGVLYAFIPGLREQVEAAIERLRRGWRDR